MANEEKLKIAAAVKVGDELIVTDGYARGRTISRGTVTKAGPAWLNIESGNRSWRLRRDTRTNTNDASKTYAYSPRWMTIEEHEETQRITDAYRVLGEQGIRIDSGSPWYGREIELTARLTSPVPRGTVHAATIMPDGLGSILNVGLGCESIPCSGKVTIQLGSNYVTKHLTENERIALIEALGGVA